MDQSVSTLEMSANDAFVDEEYETALKLYSEAIKLNNNDANLFMKRSQTLLKLGRPEEAEKDGRRATELDPGSHMACFRHGVTLFESGRFQDAYRCFQKGLELSPSHEKMTEWLKKCEGKLNAQERAAVSEAAEEESAAVVPEPESMEVVEEAKSGPVLEPVQMPKPKVKYDFYQTEEFVIVTILLKQVKKEDFTMDISPKSLSVSVRREADNFYTLELDLAHDVVPDKCTSRVSPAKIEIKLKKKEGIRWSKLEGDVDQPEPTQASIAAESSAHKYPTSRHVQKDWDKVVAEVKEDDDVDPLNGLFQKIFKDGDDETKKAMMKSFTESGGTVLSTNWKDIGAKKTEVQPPDGMEFKKYEH